MLLILSFMIQIARAGETKYSSAEQACTSKEEWDLGDAIPSKWKSQVVSKLDDPKHYPQLAIIADGMRLSGGNAESKALAQYVAWRSLFGMGLVHSAHDGMGELIRDLPTRPEVRGVLNAALQCINVMETQYPTLRMADLASQGLAHQLQAGLSGEDRVLAATVLTHQIEKRAAEEDAENKLSAELQALKGTGAYEKIAQTLIAAATANEERVIQSAGPLFRDDKFPEGFKASEPGLRVLLSRAYYGQKQYKNALDTISKVKSQASWMAMSLSDKAWAYLMANDTGAAVGAAQQLLIGSMKHYFLPEAYEVVAIALNETCHYREAIESIKYFKKSYQITHKWIEDYYAKAKSGHSTDLYALVVDHVKKQTPIPDRVLGEWVRPQLFLSKQAELNLIWDERTILKTYPAIVARIQSSTKDVRIKSGSRDIASRMSTLGGTLDTREHELVQKIQSELARRTKQMREELADASANMQLIEAEIYNNLGERMIAQYSPAARAAQKRGPASAIGKKKSIDSGKTWDWGTVPAGADEDVEVWEDELGFLQADLSDKCLKK